MKTPAELAEIEKEIKKEAEKRMQERVKKIQTYLEERVTDEIAHGCLKSSGGEVFYGDKGYLGAVTENIIKEYCSKYQWDCDILRNNNDENYLSLRPIKTSE